MSKRLYNYDVDVSGTWYTSVLIGPWLLGREWPSSKSGFVGSNPTAYTNFRHRKICMKKALLILSLLTTNAFAEMEKSPTDMYPMTKLLTTQTTVVIHTTKDVQGTCNAEKIRRKEAIFRYSIDACAFFEAPAMKVCHVYVGERTNNDILGHEVRHCFQGHFH